VKSLPVACGALPAAFRYIAASKPIQGRCRSDRRLRCGKSRIKFEKVKSLPVACGALPAVFRFHSIKIYPRASAEAGDFMSTRGI